MVGPGAWFPPPAPSLSPCLVWSLSLSSLPSSLSCHLVTSSPSPSLPVTSRTLEFSQGFFPTFFPGANAPASLARELRSLSLTDGEMGAPTRPSVQP